MGEWAGKPKQNKPVSLVFELTHPRHAIRKKAEGDPEGGPFTGDFIRNHDVTVRLNKSNSDRSKYMKLFNKLNYDGAVATPAGKVPSFASFLNKPFYGAIHHNEGKDGKVYVNLDKDGEYTIGAPKMPELDSVGTPTGSYKVIPVPEMNGEQRCFLWETGVSDEVYKTMWDSIAIVGEKKDGTPFKNWIQEAILSEENVALPGSRAERLFAANAEEVAALEEDLAAGLTPATDVPSTEAITDMTAALDAAPVADPLADLGI
jgi:hypothetical protein